MHKYSFVIGIVIVWYMFGASLVRAELPPPSTGVEPEPVWIQQTSIDTTAFRYSMQVTPPVLKVPTVVEIPLSSTALSKEAVAVGADGTVVPALYNVALTSQTISQAVTGDAVSVYEGQSLRDGAVATHVSFPFTEGVDNVVVLTIESSTAFETSDLSFMLPAYAPLPNEVRITALSIVDDAPTTLVSRTKVTGTKITFPVVRVQRVRIEFFVSQPLRLAEIGFTPLGVQERRDSVRFLVQPGEVYTLYVDPDRKFGTIPRFSGDLSSNTGTRVLPEQRMVENPTYKEADSDSDQIVNSRDNCPSVSNPQQEDIDQNGRGDMCDDFDRDGVMTTHDNCPSAPNLNQADTDRDGIGDACDTMENRFTERHSWVPWMGMGIAATILGFLFVSVLTMKKPDELDELGGEHQVDTSDESKAV